MRSQFLISITATIALKRSAINVQPLSIGTTIRTILAMVIKANVIVSERSLDKVKKQN